MGIQRAVLLIADIGGCTNYMHWNRKHLAHAQWTVAQLLESVIDAAKGMKLAKLEGDAAFWAPGATPVSWYATGPADAPEVPHAAQADQKTIPATVRVASSGTTCRSNSSPMRAKWPNKR